VLEVGEMGGKGRHRDPCTHELFRAFIAYAEQALNNKLLWECMMELREFSPAELLACVEWRAGSAPDYQTFYNHVIRRLYKMGFISKTERGRYTLSKAIDPSALTEVLGDVWFESRVSNDGSGGCVSVVVRSHVVSGSLLEAYASYLFYCRAVCSSLVRRLFRARLKELGVGEARLRRLERCVGRAVRSVRVESFKEGFRHGGHRGKGRASKELREGYGNEEHGFDLGMCIGEAYVPLLRHWKTYKGRVVGSCRCEEAGSHGGGAG
jgi:hypothetical protein